MPRRQYINSGFSKQPVARGPAAKLKAEPNAKADAGGDRKLSPKDSGAKAPGEGKGAGSRVPCVDFIDGKCKKGPCPVRACTIRRCTTRSCTQI